MLHSTHSLLHFENKKKIQNATSKWYWCTLENTYNAMLVVWWWFLVVTVPLLYCRLLPIFINSIRMYWFSNNTVWVHSIELPKPKRLVAQQETKYRCCWCYWKTMYVAFKFGIRAFATIYEGEKKLIWFTFWKYFFLGQWPRFPTLQFQYKCAKFSDCQNLICVSVYWRCCHSLHSIL